MKERKMKKRMKKLFGKGKLGDRNQKMQHFQKLLKEDRYEEFRFEFFCYLMHVYDWTEPLPLAELCAPLPGLQQTVITLNFIMIALQKKTDGDLNALIELIQTQYPPKDMDFLLPHALNYQELVNLNPQVAVFSKLFAPFLNLLEAIGSDIQARLNE